MATKYAQDYYNFLALMCLVHCLLPPVPFLDFQFSKNRIRRETAPEKIFVESPGSEIDSFFCKITNGRFTDLNFSAYIYTEIDHAPANAAVGRRNLAENSTFAAAAGRVVNELSLEDIDLIDCLWRQDIDAEKGVFSSIQSPEYQYQTDLVVLSEKNVLQSNLLHLSVVDREISPEIDSDRGFLSTEDYKYLKESLMGDFSTIDNDNGPVKEDPLISDFDNAFLRNNNPEVSCCANNESESHASNLNNILLNRTMDDGAVIDAKNATFHSRVGNSNDEGYESTDLSSPFNEFFNEKHEKMLAFWDDSPEINASPAQRLSESSMTSLTSQPDFIPDLDILPTPHLDLTNQDVTQLFSDEQIMSDVAESYQATKIAVPLMVQPARSYTPFSDHSSSNSYLSSGHIIELRTRDEFCPENQGFWLGNTEPSTSTGHRSANSFHATSSACLPQISDSRSIFEPSTSRFDGCDRIAHNHTYFSNEGDENFRPPPPMPVSKLEDVEKLDEDLPIKQEMNEEEEVEEDESSTYEVWVGAEEIAPPSSSSSTTTAAAMIMRYQAVNSGAQQQERPQIFAPSRRDEDLLRQYRITLSAWDINNMPAEELQRLLNVGGYSPGQAEIIRAVRRRGRNKVAAQFCRQRRYDAVRRLETEVDILQRELQALTSRREQLLKEKDDELRAIEKISTKK